MRVFITGATGFAGSHLVDSLLADNHQIFALVHKQSSHQELPSHPALTPVMGDLLDPALLEAAIAQAKPDVIYHLAGQAYPARSWHNPALTVAVNTGGTVNLLQAAVVFGRPRVVVVTSAEIYGVVSPQALPITETSLPRPHHPYGVSKYAAGQFVSLYRQHYDLPVIEARPFNHIGPRQSLGFVVPDFASQLAAVKVGQKPATISVGNLDAERDFTDVRDVVRAYRCLAEQGEPGETYLICSGQPVSIRHILHTLIALSGLDIEIHYDATRMRPSDTPRLYGSYRKIKEATGWQPQIALRQSLNDALDDWVARVQNQ